MSVSVRAVMTQSYAQQLQETERRLADLMRTEQQLRHRRSGTVGQQRDLHDPNVQQGRFIIYIHLYSPLMVA